MKLLFIQLFFIICCQQLINSFTPSTSKTTNVAINDPCATIESAFENVTEVGEKPACRCLPESLGILHESNYNMADLKQQNILTQKIWIGCTRQNMPAVFRLLNALKEKTYVSEMWIWNSLINILPNDMFAYVRPKTLVIENSGVSVFRKGVFSSIGTELQSLSLKNNILKNIEHKIFSDLVNLRSLDLSGNKLAELRKDQFDNLRNLEKLLISGNLISSIEDGTFESLANVHTLSLQHNRLVNITKNTFRGLSNVEVLSLNSNSISSIEKDAFIHMKKLKVLYLGSNQISELKIRNLPNLKQLYLQNNSFTSLEHLVLQDLPKLTLLNIDRNRIDRIGNDDFLFLTRSNKIANENRYEKSPSPQLTSLSLVGNNISKIGCHAFENLSNLKVLSLQSNQISTLSCPSNKESVLVQSVLRNLKNLRSLFLSNNIIEALDDGDINILPNLKELALDHNKISKIGRNTLKGLNLSKLFLNNNWLYYFPEGIFDYWDIKQIKAIDLAENRRECICDREWIEKWLMNLGAANVRAGSLGCLATCGFGKNSRNENDTIVSITTIYEGHSLWITIIAMILAIVAFIFLIAASYIYMQSSCYPISSAGLSLRNLPSDMIRLIPSQESLISLPNPIAGAGGSELLLKSSIPPQPISTISINIGHEKLIDGILTSNNTNKVDKKRVRFDGI